VKQQGGWFKTDRRHGGARCRYGWKDNIAASSKQNRSWCWKGRGGGGGGYRRERTRIRETSATLPLVAPTVHVALYDCAALLPRGAVSTLGDGRSGDHLSDGVSGNVCKTSVPGKKVAGRARAHVHVVGCTIGVCYGKTIDKTSGRGGPSTNECYTTPSVQARSRHRGLSEKIPRAQGRNSLC